jgi:hypothetical protein
MILLRCGQTYAVLSVGRMPRPKSLAEDVVSRKKGRERDDAEASGQTQWHRRHRGPTHWRYRAT